MSKRIRDIIVVGFALFAIFFGAGNLIFPVYLGLNAGQNWFSSMVGFVLTDPFLAVLVIIVTTKLGGQAEDIGKRVGPGFAKGLGVVSILSIATFIAVPRTAATVHEIAIQPNFPNISPVVTSVIFFALVLYFVMNKGKVMDRIGNFLTPFLLITLVIFIGWIIISPPGEMMPSEIQGSDFLVGFTEGYQTMDALGANLMAGILVTDFIRKGYTDKYERYHNVLLSGVIAFLLLTFVYGGLVYAGATFSSIFDSSISRSALLIAVFAQTFGRFGATLISVVVTLACLTTAVGLTATCGNYFQSISNKKLSYKTVAITSASISLLISLFSVDEIITYAGPLLEIVYPVVMMLIILSAFDRYIKYDLIYIGGVVGTFIVSISEVLLNILGLKQMQTAWQRLVPLAELGFGWIIPALTMALIGGIIAHFFRIGKTIDDHDQSRAVY